MKKEFIMKRIYYIMFMSLIMLTAVGCKDFLNVESPSSFDANYVFSNTSDAKRMVLGAYALFTEDAFTSRMSNAWAQSTDVEASESKLSTSSDKTDMWTLQRGRLQGLKDNNTCWENNYLAVDRSNQCIEGIKASSISSDKDMQQMLGECYTLRAYRYLLLTQIWGDVPYFRASAKSGMQLDIPRTDKNLIYSASIQDMINCEEKMYFADQFSDGIERMNREFTLGLISRIALFRAGYSMNHDGTMKRADDYLDVAHNDSLAVKYTYNGTPKTARTSDEYYQLAKDYCEKLMSIKDRQLNPSFSQIFLNECQYLKPVDSEVLYEMAFGSASSGGDVGWNIGIGVSASTKGTTTLSTGLNPGYYFTFDSKDVRRDITISKISYTGDATQAIIKSITNLTIGKWCRLWVGATNSLTSTSSKGTGINWPIMRYSDVLLMFAEAENHLNGPTSSAKQALRRVRNRAFAAQDQNLKVEHYLDSVSVDQPTFFSAIVNERAWEFGGECLRKYDLIRWNLYGPRIDQTITLLRNIGKAANLQELNNPAVSKYSTYADKLYYKVVNGLIVFLNDGLTKVDPTVTDITGYSTMDWGRSTTLYSVTAGGDGYYLLNTWLGYTYNKADATNVAPYLMPIPTMKTAASKYLRNDGYRLNQFFQ